MKLSKNYLALSAFAVAALSGVSAQAALKTTYADGDLLLGFRQTTGTANAAGSSLVVDLGLATTYRDATGDISIANIGAQLAANYGANWYESTALWMGAVGANNGNPIDNSGSVAAGVDPNSTAYITSRRNPLGTFRNPQSPVPGASLSLSGSVQPAAQNIGNLGVVFNANNSNGVALISTSATNGWNSYLSGSTGTDINGLFNVERAFTSGAFGTFGTDGSVENLLDLYRLPEYAPPGTSGVGSFLGTFAINSAGDLFFNSALAPVPEPSTMLFGAAGLLGLAFRRSRKAA